MELLSLIPVIGFALLWMRWQNSTAAPAVLHAVAAMIMILFLGSLVGLLLQTTLLLKITGTVLAATEAWRLAKDRKPLPVPIAVFAILGISYWIVQSGSSYYYYDEYSHWGVFLKEMLANNQLWGSETNSMHPRYLPGTSLWQYYFALYSKNVEGAAYLAQFSILITALLVLWEKTTWRQPLWILGILAFVIVVVTNFGHGFTSLYVDHLLGAWFAGVLLNFVLELQHRSVTQLSSYLLPLLAIVLFKSTGAFFVLACAGTITTLLFFHPAFVDREIPIVTRLKKVAYFPAATIALSLLVLFSWNMNRNAISLAETGGSTSTVASRLISHESIFDDAQQAELTRRYLEVITHQQISKDEVSARYNAFSYALMPQFQKRFRLTTVSLLGLSLIALLLMWRAGLPPDRRQGWAIAAACTWLIAVAYIGFLYVGYRYVSGDFKGLELSSYIRYSHSMLLPVVIFCFVPLMPAFSGSSPKNIKLYKEVAVSRHSVLFVCALVALLFLERPYLKPLYSVQQAPQFRTQLDSLTSQLRARIGEARLWVFYPDNASNGFAGQILQYQLSPGRAHVEHDPAALLNDQAALKNELRNWEYLWYLAGSPELDIAFQTLIGEEPVERVYRIDKSGGVIKFEAVRGVFGDGGS
jgi:uncharacterized membrane protein (UPF0136 family)